MKKTLIKTALVLSALFSTASFAAEQRVISIGGDVTEIVYALNAQNLLVGRDSTSMTPKTVLSLPDVGYMRQLNAEGLLSLKPTLILASELSQPTLALEQVKNSGVSIVSVPGTPSLETVTKKIAVVADALEKARR